MPPDFYCALQLTPVTGSSLDIPFVVGRDVCYDGGAATRECHLDQIGVEASARGSGVGRALLWHATASLWRGTAELSLWSPLDLQRFYEETGFEPRPTPCNFRDEDLDNDHIHMVLARDWGRAETFDP